MFGAKFNHEVRFFADGSELSGVESIDLSYQASSNVATPLGTSKGVTVLSGPTQQKLSINRYLISDDPLLAYTGDISMSGSIFYENVSYGFRSGYLSDYSLNCAVGAVPRVSANFGIFDEMKTGVSASGVALYPLIDIPTQGSITATCDHVSTNRVVGFDYSISASRKVFYTIGSNLPADVVFYPPLQYTASVQIEVDDAFLQSGFAFLNERENKTVLFSIAGREGNLLQSVSIPNASVVGEALNISADGSVKLTINYAGHS